MSYVEISEKSLTVAAEAAGSKLHHYERMADDNRLGASIEAHARTLDAFEAFRKEVSDAVEDVVDELRPTKVALLSRFIIAKPDPLVEAMREACGAQGLATKHTPGELTEHLRAALAARGLEIREMGQ